jgi:N-acetylmuramoyl-L-alanine amidase
MLMFSCLNILRGCRAFTRQGTCPILTIFICLAGSLGHAQSRSQFKQARWDTKGDYTRFVIEFTGGFTYTSRDDQVREGYFYIDVKGVRTAGVRNQDVKIDDQRLMNALVRPFANPEVLRFVFNTDGVHPFVVTTLQKPDRLIVDVYDRGKNPANLKSRPSGSSRTATTSPSPLAPKQVSRSSKPAPASTGLATVYHRTSRKSRTGKRPFRVVIDPGHGGHSKGTKTRQKFGGKIHLEKDVALAISLELKKLLDADPTIDAVFTRTFDTYLSLEERVNLAEKARGDLFLSVHLNAIPKEKNGNTARGIEFFYVNDRGKDQLKKRISRNAGGLSGRRLRQHAESKVNLLTKQSKAFCRALERACTKISYFKSHNRGLKEANFYVLKNAYMPTALIEICFLSNPNDAKYIIQRRNQKAVAQAMYQGIKQFQQANQAR